MSLTFEWDAEKAQANVRKHGVRFEEACSAFFDALSLTIADKEHSEGESRWVLVGLSERGRLLVVSHVDRGDTIRLVSARPATRHERLDYEKA